MCSDELESVWFSRQATSPIQQPRSGPKPNSPLPVRSEKSLAPVVICIRSWVAWFWTGATRSSPGISSCSKRWNMKSISVPISIPTGALSVLNPRLSLSQVATRRLSVTRRPFRAPCVPSAVVFICAAASYPPLLTKQNKSAASATESHGPGGTDQTP